MRLLIISDMAHYYRDGQIVGHGPTTREISHLASLFDTVNHIAFLYAGEAPTLMLPYQADNVRLIPVTPSGGENIQGKLGILRIAPLYIKTILSELPTADVVHVRCPASISLMAVVLLAVVLRPHKRWIKYAGNWQPQGREARAYTFQRWWLNAGLTRGQVTVNGAWPRQPSYVHSFLNPCLTSDELQQAEQLNREKCLAQPVRLLFVGHLNVDKGVGRALQIVAALRQRHIDATLDLIGDGEARAQFEAQARELGITDCVMFHGWVARTALGSHYAQAHFMLFPSDSEGWPKVLSEAMAYGAVPIAGSVSSIPQYLRQFGTGRAIDPYDVDAFAEAIIWYIQQPEVWLQESMNGQKAAYRFTYSAYLEQVRSLLGI